MAKGSVRKKGKKWYYRFYIEDESGNLVQREFVGTESKSETEALLRKAMEDYEEKKFVAKSENATVGMLLDMWVEEELKPGSLSNGTVMAYQGTVNRIKQHPIGSRKLKTVTADHLQAYMDFLSFGGTNPDGTTAKALSKGYLRLFSAVLQGAFHFAVFPKRLITFNPMQYVVWRGKKEDYDLFSDEDGNTDSTPTLSHEQYLKLEEFLKKKDNPALLPIQIAYYTGLRIGVSMAKGICYGQGLHLVSVPTLELLCVPVLLRHDEMEENALLVPMIDARRMEVYAQVFDRALRTVRPVQADVVDEETYREYLDRGPVYFFGNGAEKCMEVIHHPNAHFIKGIEPLAKYMMPLAEKRIAMEQYEDVAYFAPFYLKEYVAKQPKKLL